MDDKALLQVFANVLRMLDSDQVEPFVLNACYGAAAGDVESGGELLLERYRDFASEDDFEDEAEALEAFLGSLKDLAEDMFDLYASFEADDLVNVENMLEVMLRRIPSDKLLAMLEAMGVQNVQEDYTDCPDGDDAVRILSDYFGDEVEGNSQEFLAKVHSLIA